MSAASGARRGDNLGLGGSTPFRTWIASASVALRQRSVRSRLDSDRALFPRCVSFPVCVFACAVFPSHLWKLLVVPRLAERLSGGSQTALMPARRSTLRLCTDFGHQPLWIQSGRTLIYLLPSFLIRVQSWLSGRCDITGDTHQLAPLIHPLLFKMVSFFIYFLHIFF